MKIVVAHNFYQQAGGEDRVFHAERDLLRAHGHQVEEFLLHNDAVATMGQLKLAAATIWNRSSHVAMRDLVSSFKPDIVHVHNTMPLMSPSVYYAARARGAAVVQTLHNYRLLCPKALLFRDGAACEECVGRTIPLPAIKHKCYRDSRAASAALATMLTIHKTAGTYSHKVDMYITPTEFARTLFLRGGLSADRVITKPHFVAPVPEIGTGSGNYAIFVGRLSPEKGLDTLLAAWRTLPGIPLKIIGDGPLAPQVEAAVRDNPAIQWLGRQPTEQVMQFVGDAAFLVFTSQVYETFGLVAAEAFAKGTPVIAATGGATAELISPNVTGHHFTNNDPADLAAIVRRTLADPLALAQMRRAARQEFLNRYTADENYRQLMRIYKNAIAIRFPSQTPTASLEPDPA